MDDLDRAVSWHQYRKAAGLDMDPIVRAYKDCVRSDWKDRRAVRHLEELRSRYLSEHNRWCDKVGMK